MTSVPGLTAWAATAGSRRSPSTNRTPGADGSCRSATVTSAPLPSSAVTSRLPIKPDPPVTSTWERWPAPNRLSIRDTSKLCSTWLYRVPPGHVTRSGGKLPGGRLLSRPWPGRYPATRATRGYGDACRAPGTGCRRTATAAVPGQCSRAFPGTVLGARAWGHASGAAGGRPASVTLDRCRLRRVPASPRRATFAAACFGHRGGYHARAVHNYPQQRRRPGWGYAVTRGDPGVMAARRGQ